MSRTKQSSYRDHPDLTRYVAADRYHLPKEDFKAIGKRLKELLEPQRRYKVADVGCGNGELLYYLSTQFPQWELHGFDHTKEFIEKAQNFEGLRSVKFSQKDLFDLDDAFDVVVGTCLLSLFRDVRPPLEKMLNLCRKGGYVFATGLFNPFDIEVRVEFCDNTNPKTKGEWRTDFNRHSQESVRRMFGHRVQSIEFRECTYDVVLQQDPHRPLRVWSFKDQDGKTILINGANQVANQTLLVMHK